MQVGAKFENMAVTRKQKALVAFMVLELLGDPNDRVKRGKTSEWLKERSEKGMFQSVIQLSLQDTPAFKDMMRMSPDQFKEILNAIEPDICKQSTKMGSLLRSRYLCGHATLLPRQTKAASFELHSFPFLWTAWRMHVIMRGCTNRGSPFDLKIDGLLFSRISSEISLI